MKIEETKEIKAILPDSFLRCVNTLEKHRKLGHFSAWSVGNSDYLVSLYTVDEALVCNEAGMHPAFDLASLTKPLLINTLLRNQWGDNFAHYVTQPLKNFHWQKTDWNADLLDFIKTNDNITWDTFLSHNSNFDAWTWCKFFISVRKAKNIKADFFQLLKKHYTHKKTSVYSDLNYMFLALLMESLFDFSWNTYIKSLNSSQNTSFFHASITPENTKYAIPSYPYILLDPNKHHPDENETLGFVHDTNANLFASLNKADRIVSGHAGLYGNICDVFNGISTLRKTQPKSHSMVMNEKFSYGLEKLLHQEINVLGHFGYTGTSFWFDPNNTNQNDKRFILLTNRTSHRKSCLASQSPLALIITDKKNDHTYQFLVHDQKIENLSKEEFLDKSGKYFYNTEKFCDNSIILDYFNLSELRKTLATQIS
jgi:hypothetical protein